MERFFARILTIALVAGLTAPASEHLRAEDANAAHRVAVTFDRGDDIGQSFGSLFEARTSDGSLVIGAGFQNAYNTRYRGDRHEVQFFIRPASGEREIAFEELPRPSKQLTGAYLFSRDGVVYSTYGGLKSWNAKTRDWVPMPEAGGTMETMRVGDGKLAFGDSQVTWNGRIVLGPPMEGRYQLFFYANGHLCFYHVNRKSGSYRPYANEEDGFSRLYACPWTPAEAWVDLTKACVLRLPVVGETTFAWGQLRNQIVTGSNIGGFYIFEDGAWKMLLEPKLGVSYQLYSTLAFHDRLLMGQYPTGRLFSFDGKSIRDQAAWPPVLEGVSSSAREAQTTTIYGGELMVGVWPWGEVWRFQPDRRRWSFVRRMFNHPELSQKIVHPYDVENRGNSPQNLWGQRVTSMVPHGADLLISTSAKAPYSWNPDQFAFLAPEKWKDYGKVYRARWSGHLSAATKWTAGPTTMEFHFGHGELSIRQDGVVLARTSLDDATTAKLRRATIARPIRWGEGIFGPHAFRTLRGSNASE